MLIYGNTPKDIMKMMWRRRSRCCLSCSHCSCGDVDGLHDREQEGHHPDGIGQVLGHIGSGDNKTKKDWSRGIERDDMNKIKET